MATTLNEIPIKELKTINPFTLAPWVRQAQVMLANKNKTGPIQADAGWAVRIAVSSSARNGVVGVGGGVCYR